MKKVLIIEDSPSLRILLTEWLKDDGWQVLEADDGDSGLELARKHRPEVIICDLLMPRFNGYQVCRALRGDTSWPHRPKIVVTTASDYPADRQNALDAGADEYLVKPVDRLELLKVIGSATDVPDADGELEVPEQVEERFRIRFWGVRGSVPTPGPSTVKYGGNTSCVEVRAGGRIIILDAGTGIRRLGKALRSEFSEKPVELAVLLTHTHWDHIQGFPFFQPAYVPKNKVRIYSYEGARSGLNKTLSSQMESPYFPISMNQLPGNIAVQELKETSFSIGPVDVRTTFLHHPGVCAGYRIATGAGSMAYVTDHEPFERFMVETGKNSPEDLVYAREQDQRIIDFIDGAQVLIIDSQYSVEEYPQRAGWGHGCVDDVVDIALKAKVKHLYLFHHDPDHTDAFIDRMVARGVELAQKAGSDLTVEAAQEDTERVLAAVASEPR